MDLKYGFLQKFDWLLALSCLILSMLGLLAIYSTDLGDIGTSFLNFKKQLVALFLGVLILVIASILNYRQLRNAKNILYFISFSMLLAVLILGQHLRGTTGWFVLGPFSFQPVEIVKIILVIFLADYFTRQGRMLFAFKDIIKSLLAAAILIGPVLYQPDLGSSIILFLIWAGMLLASKIQKKHIIIMVIAFIAISIFAWFFLLADFQKKRIEVFINPELDPLGSGYNIKQSIIAIGSGGFWGKGLGFGSQSQLLFLPESHTDFIFALIAEEMGLVIVLVVLGLYGVFFWRILKLAKDTDSDFVSYLSIGFLVMFMAEMVINIGMNLGLMPVTGLALPFMSLGGSSLVSKFLAVGILESVKMRS